MRDPDDEKALGEKALELADEAISLGAAERYAEALQRWEQASAFTDQHLAGRDIDRWIKSGLGAALFDAGRYRESIAVSETARLWCLKIGQPLPSLTLARSYLRLALPERAASYLQEVYGLIGDDIYQQFDAPDHEAIRTALARMQE
jgi:tetratricopeptide (TPR) repeat protein